MADNQEESTIPLSNDIARERENGELAPPRASYADDLGLPDDTPEDQEEPTLPPHSFSLAHGEHAIIAPSKRKRSTVSQLMSDSSDMPIFSSDDDPAAENYRDGHGRQKRQYTGSWDRQQPIRNPSPGPEPRVRRKLERQVDSGVFMGSDVSTDSNFDVTTTRFPVSDWKLPVSRFAQIPRSSRPLDLSSAEAKARERVQFCVDTDNETIDLTNLNLHTISGATVAKLMAISPAPCVRRGVPFSNPDPQLKLFLFQNSLTRLPKELFHLEYLTVLSLRANRLTEIPPTISEMTNLRELNLSQNLLKHLPMEILQLVHYPDCHLETLSLFPNPFCQPEVLRPGTRQPAEFFETPLSFGNRWLSKSCDSSRLKAKYWARTPVQFSSTKGDVFSTFRLDSGKYLATEDVTSEPTFPTQPRVRNMRFNPTRVLSLTELMLQSCLRSTEITPDYWRNSYMCDPAYAPGKDYSHIIDPLEDMQRQRESGSLYCTVCQRNVVRPTAQWIEWWELWRETANDTVHGGPSSAYRRGRGHPDAQNHPPSPQRGSAPLTSNPCERLVPFLRRACSWKCVNDPVRGLGNPAPRR